MNELENIYNAWSEGQAEPQNIKKVWDRVLSCLQKNCPEPERDELASCIMEYGRLVEQNAFQSGFRKSAYLCVEIFKK